MLWNNSIVLSSVIFSNTQISATLPANLLATPSVGTIQVQNPNGQRSNALTFNVTQATFSILTDTLPAATVGVNYLFPLTATGGSAPYTWGIVGGTLPGGLSLTSSGSLAGVPSTAGTFTFVVRVTTGSQLTAQKALSLIVNPPPFSISTNSPLPQGIAGSVYSAQLVAAGGVPPIRWTVSTAPPGLVLDSSTGVLRGTPTASGNFTIVVQAADNSGLTASKTFTLTVSPPLLSITTDAVFPGVTGGAYAQSFSATGGVPPYRWSILSGAPAAGLTLDSSTGALSGTPQITGSFTFVIQVADITGATVSKPFTMVVEPPRLNILTASPLPTGTVGIAYSHRFGAVGGTPEYTWSISAGSVPGLSFAGSTGVLSGVPATAGTYTFNITAADSAGLMAVKSFSLTISPGTLTILTSRDPLSAKVGVALRSEFEVQGGVPPYTWSANGLPEGLSLDSTSGVLDGIPVAPGAYSFTVRVTDSLRSTVVDLFRISVAAPAIPNVMLSGLPATADPSVQLLLGLNLASNYPIDLKGQLMLAFIPDAGAGDPAIQFSTGGRAVAFSIAAGSTSASFSGQSLRMQTGTIAGTIRISVQFQVGDVDVTPDPVPIFSSRIERSAPQIGRPVLTRSSSGFTVQLSGFSTAREVTQAVFTFSVPAGVVLQTRDVTLSVENLFNQWYQDPNSARFGSQFSFSQQFTVQGNASLPTLESVTLTNRFGSMTAKP
ncbi:MAG TPA: putative Ig domain-containing protein [Bryobacteraceae bacterium]|nr:putative Ig domain-containing protein [Bryobacteraceae bacterium]